MKIVLKSVYDLFEYDNNPRHNDEAVEAVANSIREFGFKVPIIITSEDVIVAGHTRLKASKKLGLTEVPCIIADDLTEEQIKAFRLADNKTSELATWNFEALTEELDNIDMDMLQFGFEDLYDDIPDNAEDDDFDVYDELEDDAESIRGDIYVLGRHRVLCGDSTLKADVDTLVNGQEVDMIFTDPPYNVDYEGTAGKIQNDKQEDSEFYDFLFKAFTNMFEHTKKGGSIYVCHADTEGLNFRNAYKNAGFKLASCLIWVKNSLVLGRQDYHWRHEPILYGWKEGAAHYFIDDRTQDTIWEYNKPRRNEDHPTMKPLELVGKAISNSSRPNELVLDLFGGSGSTLIAAEQLSRVSYLMELDERYVDVIVKRFIRSVGEDLVNESYRIRDGVKTYLKDIEAFNQYNRLL